MKLRNISEVALYVKNLDESEKFYVGILGLEVVKRSQSIPARDLFLKCGDTMLLLFDAEQTKIDKGIVPTHGMVGEGHLAFGIEENKFTEYEEYLIKNSIQIEKKANWDKGTQSIYFRDPSGNSLEFISENHWSSNLNIELSKKDFNFWNYKKIKINDLESRPEFREGEIWFCKLGINVGFEEDGKGEDSMRPVLVTRKFNKQIFYGIPLTSTVKDSIFYYPINHNGEVTGSAILSQMRLIDAKRLSHCIGVLNNIEFKKLKEKLKELFL